LGLKRISDRLRQSYGGPVPHAPTWGWADTALNPQMGISYYDELIAQYGLKGTQDFYRLFLVPGVAHCSGGYGPDDIDALTAVINWVEAGVVPERLSARRESRKTQCGGGINYL
jgi:hypothetical protein